MSHVIEKPIKTKLNVSQYLALGQPSHILMVFGKSKVGKEKQFKNWYTSDYRARITGLDTILSVEHYRQYPLNLGNHKPIGFDHLGIYQLSLDGAEDAQSLLKSIHQLFEEEASAENCATWIYYPVSEKVGCQPDAPSPYLTIAFANAAHGRESEFREWYSTQHLRHALALPALVSGQRFEKTEFQISGALGCGYETIAIYEQYDAPERLLASFSEVDLSKIQWSMAGDVERFTEWVYQLI